MNLEEDIELIKNRYINSCHHLDSQLARIFDFLKERNLMQNTIVILTGDHGEEFMEKGRWGHGSTFAEEQIKTPLVLWIPGIGSNRVKRMTSHLDIVPTLLPLMGVKNPPEDYSFGYNLLNDFQRTGTVVSDWSHICFVDSSHKLSIPLKASGGFNNELKTRDDVPVADKEPFMENRQKTLVKLMRQMRRFKQK
jgi:hypothetical protein